GEMVVYAAGIGEEALDRLSPTDNNPNGLFVRELLPELQRPGIALDDAVDAAAERIAQQAESVGRQQNPALYKAYYGKFQLVPPERSSEPEASGPVFAPPYGGADSAAFFAIRNSNDVTDWQSFVAKYPASPLVVLAQ